MSGRICHAKGADGTADGTTLWIVCGVAGMTAERRQNRRSANADCRSTTTRPRRRFGRSRGTVSGDVDKKSSPKKERSGDDDLVDAEELP